MWSPLSTAWNATALRSMAARRMGVATLRTKNIWDGSACVKFMPRTFHPAKLCHDSIKNGETVLPSGGFETSHGILTLQALHSSRYTLALAIHLTWVSMVLRLPREEWLVSVMLMINRKTLDSLSNASHSTSLAILVRPVECQPAEHRAHATICCVSINFPWVVLGARSLSVFG